MIIYKTCGLTYLVNAANVESGVDIKRAFIDILERLTPIEAQILEKIYSLPFEVTHHNGVRTDHLPSAAYPGEEDDSKEDWDDPSDEIKLALASLARINCISLTRPMGGGEIFSSVNPTLMGKSFVEACTIVNTVEI